MSRRAKKVLKKAEEDPNEVDIDVEEYVAKGNKRVTEEQVKDIRRAFNQLDKDHSGKIDAEELKVALKKIGMETNQQNIDAIITYIDRNGDKEIDFDEFFIAMSGPVYNIHKREDIDHIFEEFTGDKDGYIDSKTIREACKDLDEEITEEEIDNMIKFADLDNDGKINADEFYYILTVDPDTLKARKIEFARAEMDSQPTRTKKRK